MLNKGKAVRLSDSAHALLAVRSDDSGITQKEIASKAIILLTKREDKDRELLAAHANVIRLEEKIRDNKLFAFGTFLLGSLIGACLMFAVGVAM